MLAHLKFDVHPLPFFLVQFPLAPGHEADRLEKELGMRVIRHKRKKPDGSAEELERHFGCPPQNLVMIGDR